MKTFIKVFFVSFLFFILSFSIGSYSYLKERSLSLENNIVESREEEKKDLKDTILAKLESKPKEPKSFPNLEEAMEKSNRINFLIMGLDDVRTDTIIFASFCPDSKKVNLINIPRDTYIHRKGYNAAEQRKINSIYEDHGALGLKKAVSHILDNVPIHHIVTLNYEGVEKIVDALGGVEINVPFHMKYKDPYSKPPLNIDIPPGNQILNGKTSLEFLRYRKGNNNKGGYADGDLGRIKAQQEFLKSFIGKASENLITTVTKGFNHVKTDMNLLTTISYGRKALGMTSDDVEMKILPGKAEFKRIGKKVLSYYIYNKNEIRKVLEEIYNVKKGD
ncbi:MAG: LytR family transcriptional regulator [Tissierellia bacterium]|nr:LytR family transcriptional regulator [Tissierellia bacterium]